MFLEEETALQRGTDERAEAHSKIVVVIPAFNEERFIGSVVLQSRLRADDVIVVDDGSTDNTAAIAEAAGATILRQNANQGKGVALAAGFREAAALDPDVVITVDADGQHVVAEVDQVARPVLRGEADIVIGSRYLEENSDVPGHRILGHRLFNFMTNQASGVSVTDSQSGFRAFSPRALRAISFKSDGFSVESEMQFIANEHDLELVEAPITIHYHEQPKRPVIAHGLMVLNGLLRMVGQYRPLLFFGVPGSLFLLAGTAWGIYIVDIFRRKGELAVGYALICVLLIIAGNIALTTGIILHSVRGMILDIRKQVHGVKR